MDDDPAECKRNNISTSLVLQPSRLQRAVRSYNALHSLLLGYVVYILCHSFYSIVGIFSTKDFSK